MHPSLHCDFLVVGAGIVGLTVASTLKNRFPSASIAIIDKEAEEGSHASGRNSGVLHSGIYYGKDTLKAKVCATGYSKMVEFAQEENIPVNRCGKVIVATEDYQLAAIEKLLQNARENNIDAAQIDSSALLQIEPYATTMAVGAIHCPSTAVIDSRLVVRKIKERLVRQGVTIIFNCELHSKESTGKVNTSCGVIDYGFLINCAGSYADVISKKFNVAKEYVLVPFKGIYWKLRQSANYKVKGNIYPVPDMNIPFLGVHLSRVYNDEVYIGPSAIPALGRENYGFFSGIKFAESVEICTRLISMYFRNQNHFRKLAHREIGNYQKSNFLCAAQKLVPSLNADDLIPTSKVGIRPQLVNKITGKLEMDYILLSTDDSLHVLNAISPAFTSSWTFAELIVEKIESLI